MNAVLKDPLSLDKAKLFSGFRPDSKGLFGPLAVEGHCLPDYVRPGKVIHIWADFDAPLYSGDVAIIFTLRPNGTVGRLGKRIEVTRDGRIWWYAWATRDPGSLFAHPVDSPHIYMLAVAPIVAEQEVDGVAVDRENLSGDEVQKSYGHLGARAVKEWRTQGFPPRERLKIVNDPANVAQLRKLLEL